MRATGGVGSLAIDMLAGRGYKGAALTGKKSSTAYLEQLGAASLRIRTAAVCVYHATFTVNSLAHRFGARPYPTPIRIWSSGGP